MQLQNFECQIAKAQIGRFLAGDLLGDETVEQLEAHIAKCPDCKQNLAERRAVLQAMLPTAEPAPQETPQDAPNKVKFDLAEFIKSKIQSKQPVQAAVQTASPKASNLTKPALYSIALGIVLIGMSYMSKNVGSILGPTAAKPVEAPSTAANTHPAPPSAPKPIAAKPIDKTASKVTAEPAITKTPGDVAPTPKRTSIKTAKASKPEHAHHHKTPRHDSNTVRAYEPEN
jgi:hypothetical protein